MTICEDSRKEYPTQPDPQTDLLFTNARSKRGELMTWMGRLDPDSAAISKNVKIIQIRQDLTKL